MELLYPAVKECRVCRNPSLIPCVNLGAQYLSSVFPENLQYYRQMSQLPLNLVMCEKRDDGSTCGLLQLEHQLDLSAMYQAYPYTSSTNSSMPAILKDVAQSGRAFGHLQSGDVILDIGSNDGTLLSFFQNEGFLLIGIDPAQNIKLVFDSKGFIHVRDFFSIKSYKSTTSKKASLIFSIAMFYHLDDPVSFSRDVAECLADDGVWIIQMAYLPAMLQTNMYDNIVHEHRGYYALQHLKWIMDSVGLEIFDVQLNNVYGGSFRVFVKKKGYNTYTQAQHYQANLRKELELGLFDLSTYLAFMRRIEKTRLDLCNLSRKLKSQGKTIWVYGASTKGNTILQYCGLNNNDIDAACDANPFKVGRYMIGSDIPIKDEASLRAVKPDYLLALPYSFVEGFLKREAELVAKGTKFIVPLPGVRIIP